MTYDLRKNVDGYSSSSTMLTITTDDKGPILAYEAPTNSGFLLYIARLFQLNHKEMRLNDGRFKNYKATLRENEVVKDVDTQKIPSTYGDYLKEQIEWVADQTFNTPLSWAFCIETVHISYLENHFFFSDKDLAVHFKLYWS